jgi:NADH:ubiquinone oxidoreductase subunit 3 (subunit A)
MPSSWDVYYVVFLSALLALGVPALLGLFSYLASAERAQRKEGAGHRKFPASKKPVKNAVTAELLRKKINARFFLGVNASLILMAIALILIPCTGMLQQATDRGTFFRCLIAIVSLATFCGLGLLYSSRKGDLSWVHSFQKPKSSSSSTLGGNG